MKPEYASFVQELIAERRASGTLVDEKSWSDQAVARCQCDKWAKRFVEKFPHLRIEKGWYVLGEGEDVSPIEHWWCVDVDGTVVDPTAIQFMPGGCYVPLATNKFPIRVGGCMECGDSVYNNSNAEGFCCTECRDSFAAAMA